MENIVEEIVDEVEELFPPKPGGLVDRHRQKKAAEEAAQKDREHEAEKIEERSYKAVKVAPESPEIFSAQTFVIQPGTYAQILPNSPYRHRALVFAFTPATSTTVVLAKDSGNAISGVGYTFQAFIYSTPSFPIELTTRAQVYAYNSGGEVVNVSVMAEIYAPEEVKKKK